MKPSLCLCFTAMLAIGSMALLGGCATTSDADRIVEPPSITAKEHHDRAKALQERGHLNQALVEYDLAIAKDSGYVLAYFGRANTKSKKGDVSGALADYDRVVYYDSRFAEGYFSRGNAKMALGMWREPGRTMTRRCGCSPAMSMRM